ncbi:putative quinol monooxygenase [Sphingopyxis fribergensis]
MSTWLFKRRDQLTTRFRPRDRQSGGAKPKAEGIMVRLWELEVDPAQFEAFRAIGAENLEASTRLEPGVLMMHAVQLADDPTQVRVLEVYSGQSAYKSHIRTRHFLRYKTVSERMVRSQRLVPTNPILLCAKSEAVEPAPCSRPSRA